MFASVFKCIVCKSHHIPMGFGIEYRICDACKKENVKACNCGDCGKELFVVKLLNINQVRRRIRGRPYCEDCPKTEIGKPLIPKRVTLNDISPWQENNIRTMEGD